MAKWVACHIILIVATTGVNIDGVPKISIVRELVVSVASSGITGPWGRTG